MLIRKTREKIVGTALDSVLLLALFFNSYLIDRPDWDRSPLLKNIVALTGFTAIHLLALILIGLPLMWSFNRLMKWMDSGADEDVTKTAGSGNKPPWEVK